MGRSAKIKGRSKGKNSTKLAKSIVPPSRQLAGKRKTVAGKKALLRFETGAPTSLNKIDEFESASSGSEFDFDSDSNSKGDLDSDENAEVKAQTASGVSLPKGEKKPNESLASKEASPFYWNKKAKQRVLLCTSRNIPHRPRHLMMDLNALLPHSKKENKLDDRKNIRLLNEIAELNNTNKVVYVECRRGSDLYLWLSNATNGPSVKFQVLNEHTQDELKFSGNHLKGSRTILSFDKAFDTAPHLRVIKELLQQVFNVPHKARRSKPFFDHVMEFAWLDNKIWLRNYQLCIDNQDSSDKIADPEMSLTEVGPRFVLDPIKVFRGSFEGESLWSNPSYSTPGAIRRVQNAELRRQNQDRANSQASRIARKNELQLPEDPLRNVF